MQPSDQWPLLASFPLLGVRRVQSISAWPILQLNYVCLRVSQAGYTVGSQVHQGQLLAVLDAIQLELATELVGCQVGHARNGMWGDGGEAVQAEIEQIQLGKVIQGGGGIGDPLGYHGGQVC